MPLSPAVITELVHRFQAAINDGEPARQRQAFDQVKDAFETASPQERQSIHKALGDPIYKWLLLLAEDCALEAVRLEKPALIHIGLAALAIEAGGFDLRDTTIGMALLYESAVRLKQDPAAAFAQAAAFCPDPRAAKELRAFPHRPVSSRGLTAFPNVPTPSRLRLVQELLGTKEDGKQES